MHHVIGSGFFFFCMHWCFPTVLERPTDFNELTSIRCVRGELEQVVDDDSRGLRQRTESKGLITEVGQGQVVDTGQPSEERPSHRHIRRTGLRAGRLLFF